MNRVRFRGPRGSVQITREPEGWFSVWSLPPNVPRARTFHTGKNEGAANTLEEALAKAGDAIDRVIDPAEVPNAFLYR